MKNRSKVAVTILTAVTIIGAAVCSMFHNRKKAGMRNESQDLTPQGNSNDNESLSNDSHVLSDEIAGNRKSYAQIVKENEERGEYEPISPFFEDAMGICIDEMPNIAEHFHHADKTVYNWNSSLHPIVRILPLNRKRLDILFPIPRALYMRKNHLDMGLYYKAVPGNQTELPGDNLDITLDVFKSAFGHVRLGTDEETFNRIAGYVTKLLVSQLPEKYSKTEVEVKREGYFNVAYLVLDPFTKKYVRRHKYVNITHTDAVKNLKDNSRAGFERFLTESFEKYVLFDPAEENDTYLVEIPEDLVDISRLEKPGTIIAADQTEIQDVILAYRVSFFLLDDDHPEGITELGIAKLLQCLIDKVVISEKYNDPEDKQFRYLNPWIIEERPRKYGELNVLSLNKIGEDEYELNSIPLEDRDLDLEIESQVNDLYAEKK